jgi:glutaredoxin
MYIVYSKPACHNCDKTKALLKQQNIVFREIVLDIGQNKTYGVEYIPIHQFKELYPNARTAPQIFFNDNGINISIGGFAELQNHLNKS